MSRVCEDFSVRLKNIRVNISDKSREINELQQESDELWNKLLKDFNDNKIFFKKQEGLSGLDKAMVNDIPNNYNLEVVFTSRPSAKGLSIIEEETGLTFKENNSMSYIFILQ